ncbi:MFS transporter [Aetokthonos hydrillicola Thurmond2011]|uniref:MFS transporter n=1 Tax=Aetokthonos hydrillicola Thurmond2011 TaxID=2712845 RepID=A0AAP5I7I9_9CYAN|nr:MFS transporter [Aetokthonos hydrillicola]MBO3458226.1 MFS transporter [Aetokthonos hydrillicola CCALA 1050]MBW4584445.1 MFS transporter [Aetokthonos hydrillicola CCALA 1050]MDR9896407.1 MFS transporter [Aetokthonos hydrillicola Thurmond2011]
MTTQPKSPTNIFKDRNLYILSCITLIVVLGGNILNPSLPTIQKFFQVSSEQVSWVTTLYQLPGAIITPIFGMLADTIGRKQILIPSLLLFSLGGGLGGVAQTFRALLEWRFVQGVGAASLEALVFTIMGDIYSGRKMPIVMGFNASLIGISSALFPLIGGFLAAFSWRYSLLTSLIAIFVALLIFIGLKLPKHQTTHQAPVQKVELKSYIRQTWNSINNPHVLGLLFAAMALFTLQIGTCFTYIPILAGNFFKASDSFIGIMLATISISVAIVASQLGFFVRHFSEIKLIKIAFILFALGTLIIPLVNNIWLLFIPICLLGAAFGLSFPSTQALLAGLSAQESRAGFMAVNSTVQSWGQTLGPLLGALIDFIWGTKAVFYISAVFSVFSLVVFHLLLTPKKSEFTLAPTSQTAFFAQPEAPRSIAAPTILQQPVAQLLHVQTNRIIELPEDFSVIYIGKPNGRIPVEVDVSDLPNSGLTSRLHAQIRFDQNEYYIQDMGSSNGTYINKYPLVPGIWYKLKPGLRFSLGRRDLMTFMFEIS